jgi:hypothetical protein
LASPTRERADVAVINTCEFCGFVWSDFDPATVSVRATEATSAFAALVLSDARAAERTEPERWSTLEYGGHLRDVLLSVRDRVILAVVEDVPSPPPIYRDHRVALGLYRHDRADQVAHDLAVAARLFITTFDAVRVEHGERRLIYSQLTGGDVTINWVGSLAVHECEHHLADVRENAASRQPS